MSKPIGEPSPRTFYNDDELLLEMENLLRMSNPERAINSLALAIDRMKEEAVRNRGVKTFFVLSQWADITKALEAIASLTRGLPEISQKETKQ
jgi:hypothetical protein